MSERPINGRDHLIGGGLALAYVLWLLSGVRTLGFSRDEGFYFHAAGDYARWFDLFLRNGSAAFERAAVDGPWATNHEHPALVKSLFALSWMFLHEKWHVFTDASTAFRFPGILFSGMAVWVTYLFGARVYSRRAGVAAAALLVLSPNVFYHSHLACFDMPIVAMWILCTYLYWRATVEGGLAWALAVGLVYGLTLETKHNAWILPAVFVPHALFVYRRRIARGVEGGMLPIPLSLLAMATLGPIVFVALWPWLWNDTLQRISEYVGFHLHHEYYNIEFLRQNYWGPPSPKLYAPVMIAATVPTVTLLLFVVGLGDRTRRAVVRLAESMRAATPSWRAPAWVSAKESYPARTEAGEPDLLLFLSFAAALGPFFLEKTPIFGGTKHWMTAYPAMAIFAGRGFDLVAQALTRAFASMKHPLPPPAKVAAQGALWALVFLGPLAITAYSHPFGLSAYVPVVGGAQGAASLGLNRQFWGFTTQSVEPYFEANAPKGATVFFHDTAWESWNRMLDEKRIRPDLRGVGTPDAQFSLVQHELHMNAQEYNNWFGTGTASPDHVVTHNGVPIVSVFKKRPEAR